MDIIPIDVRPSLVQVQQPDLASRSDGMVDGEAMLFRRDVGKDEPKATTPKDPQTPGTNPPTASDQHTSDNDVVGTSPGVNHGNTHVNTFHGGGTTMTQVISGHGTGNMVCNTAPGAVNVNFSGTTFDSGGGPMIFGNPSHPICGPGVVTGPNTGSDTSNGQRGRIVHTFHIAGTNIRQVSAGRNA
ncbi:hypothetical protein H0H93_015499, partial [Arthromyces matolae]